MSKVQECSAKPDADVQLMRSRAEIITQAVLAEMQHFDQYRVGDFKEYMQRYLSGQIQFYKEVSLYQFYLLQFYEIKYFLSGQTTQFFLFVGAINKYLYNITFCVLGHTKLIILWNY